MGVAAGHVESGDCSGDVVANGYCDWPGAGRTDSREIWSEMDPSRDAVAPFCQYLRHDIEFLRDCGKYGDFWSFAVYIPAAVFCFHFVAVVEREL